MKRVRSLLLGALAIAATLIVPAGASATTDLYMTGTAGPPAVGATEYPSSIVASHDGEGPLTVLKTKFATFTCEDVAVVDPNVEEATPQLQLGDPSGEGFEDCTFEAGGEKIAVTIETNGCSYRYADFVYESGPSYSGSSEVSCDGGNEFKIRLPLNCVVSIPDQTLSDDVALTNIAGEDAFDIGMQGSGTTYTITGYACVLSGWEVGTFEDGAIDMALSAADAFMTGGAAEIEAGEYPKSISGERYEESPFVGNLTVLDIGKFQVGCEAVEVEGGTIAAPAYELTLTPAYSGCTLNIGSPVTVTMNSCRYLTGEVEGYLEDEFAFEAQIDCTTEGDAIELGLPLGCVLKIPAQSFNDLSVAANKELQGQKDIGMAIKGVGMTYVSTKFACALGGIPQGVHEDGTSEQFVLLK